MPKALHVVSGGSSTDSYVEKTISGSDVWIGFDVYVVEMGDTGAPVLLQDAFGDFSGLDMSVSGSDVGFTGYNENFSTNDQQFHVLEWAHVDLHVVLGNPIVENHFINGVDVEETSAGNEPGPIVSVRFGAMDGLNDGEYYLRDLTVGTTPGGSEIWSTNLEGDINSIFDDVVVGTGDTLAITDLPTGPPGRRVKIGFAANMLDPSPVWTTLDTVRDNLVAHVEFTDGRQTEQDETEPGSCQVYLNDTTGLFDPNNPSSPYFGVLDSKPIKISVFNPVDNEWVPQWRGTIDDIRSVLNPSTDAGVSILANVVIEAVDIFDYLGRAEMQVGVSGDVPPADSTGTVFYEDGEVNDRMIQMLDDAGVDPGMYVVFDGNVTVLESQFDAGDSFLPALREAADAEFPGIANVYVDKLGRFVFHGRFARLDPDSVIADGPVSPDVWDFNRWKAGDGAAIEGDSDNAQVREFAFGRPRELLINSAIAYPEKESDHTQLDETKIPAQLSTDVTSIGQHGIHGRADTGLIVKGHKTNGDDGWQQCKKYADFWVAYYAQPLDRVERIVFKSVDPEDPRAAATWGLITGVSISDTVDVTIGYPGGVGFSSARYYVEGRRMTVEPLNTGYDMVTLELNLSPAIEDTLGILDTGT